MTAIDAPLRLTMPADMTLQHVGTLKSMLLDALGSECPVIEVDLAQVRELDSAGVQLLLLAQRTAKTRNKALRLTEHSPTVREVFDLLNLAGHFETQTPVVTTDQELHDAG